MKIGSISSRASDNKGDDDVEDFIDEDEEIKPNVKSQVQKPNQQISQDEFDDDESNIDDEADEMKINVHEAPQIVEQKNFKTTNIRHNRMKSFTQIGNGVGAMKIQENEYNNNGGSQ